MQRTPGGTGGGGAAAVASGASAIELGGDSFGSVRQPAAFCGITAIKPTSGVIPKLGVHITSGAKCLGAWNSEGLMARHVEDLALGLSILVRYDPRAIGSRYHPGIKDYREVDLSNWRVAVYTQGDPKAGKTDTRISNVIEKGAERLAKEVKSIERATPPGIENVADILINLVAANNLVVRRKAAQEANGQKLHPIRREVTRIHEEWVEQRDLDNPDMRIKAIGDLLKFQKEIYTWMDEGRYDILLSPASSQMPRIDNESLDLDVNYLSDAAFPGLCNACEFPGGTVRGGWAELSDNIQLPVGLHIAAPRFKEENVLAALSFFEKEFGGFVPPPSQNFGTFAGQYGDQAAKYANASSRGQRRNQ